jgi:ATP-dependent DNA helicase RecQ
LVGKDYEERYWMALIRQVLVEGYLSKDIGNLWSLKVTRTRLYKSVSFMMSEDHIYNSHEDESITASKYLRQLERKSNDNAS